MHVSGNIERATIATILSLGLACGAPAFANQSAGSSAPDDKSRCRDILAERMSRVTETGWNIGGFAVRWAEDDVYPGGFNPSLQASDLHRTYRLMTDSRCKRIFPYVRVTFKACGLNIADHTNRNIVYSATFNTRRSAAGSVLTREPINPLIAPKGGFGQGYVGANVRVSVSTDSDTTSYQVSSRGRYIGFGNGITAAIKQPVRNC